MPHDVSSRGKTSDGTPKFQGVASGVLNWVNRAV
jgi:hypothetical protein